MSRLVHRRQAELHGGAATGIASAALNRYQGNKGLEGGQRDAPPQDHRKRGILRVLWAAAAAHRSRFMAALGLIQCTVKTRPTRFSAPGWERAKWARCAESKL
jgi:hypothetical protein